jgi:hypothetical protein
MHILIISFSKKLPNLYQNVVPACSANKSTTSFLMTFQFNGSVIQEGDVGQGGSRTWFW